MPEWVVITLNVGLSAILAFAGSAWGSYLASKKATKDENQEERDKGLK